MKKYSIKNSYVLGLGSWLNELELSGKNSRERTRFVKQLSERVEENEKFRKEILGKYLTEKDQTVDNLPEDVKTKLFKELTDLYEEEFKLELDDERYKIIKDLVLNTTYVFGPRQDDSEQEKLGKIRQANDYEMWCQSFEV